MRYLGLIVLLSTLGCAAKSDEQNALDDSIKKSLDEFNRRTIYTSLDPKILSAIPDDRLEQAIVDFVATKLEGNYAQEEQILAGMSKGLRAFWLTWVVEGEVNNGGFNQYYWNSEDRYAADAVKAFEFFSAREHASLMREANRLRAEEVGPLKKFKDEGTLSAFSESYKVTKLGPLDERFYALTEDLSALRIAKIRSAPELFSGD